MKRAHTELDAEQNGIALVKAIYEFTTEFPVEERCGLTSQIRRAGISIPANVVQGAARGTHKEFLHLPTIAPGSISEFETLLIVAKEVGLASDETAVVPEELCDLVSSQLSGLFKSVRRKTTV